MSILIADVIDELAILPQVCPTDPRLYRYINAAQRQIFLEGQYTGVYAPYNFLVYNSLVTLPYEAEALLAADILAVPIYVQNQWFEFLQSGPGYQDPRRNFTYPDMFDRGDGYCVVQDPNGPFTVQIYCAVPEDPNATLIIEGLDQYGNVVRSQTTTQNGDGTVTSNWINGAQSVIYNPGSPYVEIAQVFSKITAITLPKRNGDLRLLASARDPVSFNPLGITYFLGVYPWYLTNPNFRRYAFPAAAVLPPSDVRPFPINSLVRRRPIPVHCPTDRLSINNIEALRYYVMSVWKDEEEQWDTAEKLRAKGKMWLEQETRKNGTGMSRLNMQWRGFTNFNRTPGSL